MEYTTPAPYGQACTNCVRTKCRCILRGTNQSCERLNKKCTPSPSTRRRGAKRQTRAAQLEEKIEDLVTLLRSQASERSEPRGPSSCPPLEARSAVQEAPLPPSLPATDYPTPSPTASAPPPDLTSTGDLSATESEACLASFRDLYLSFFPLVDIPESTTAGQLRASRPFLWMVIVGLTCKETARRRALNKRVEEVLAQRVVVGHERDVDLLLGIVALLGWLGFQSRGQPYMWLLIHMAMGIAGDLGLDRPMPAAKGVKGISLVGRLHSDAPVSTPTPEETRAVLGCYVICSVTGAFFQRPNPMPWSPSLQQSLERLRDARDVPRDQLLVAQVQMHRLADEVAQTPWRNWSAATVGGMGAEMSPAYHMRSFNSRLEDIMCGVTDPEIAQSQPLRLLQTTVQLSIHELVLHAPPTLDLEQLTDLHTALHSTRAWFDTFFDRPASHHATVPLSLYAGFLLACQTLHRLTVLDRPGWDRAAVRSVADLLQLLDRTADLVAEVSSAARGPEDGGAAACEDIFARASWQLRAQRAKCAARLGEAEAAEEGGLEVGAGLEFQDMLGYPEGLWMADVFGDTDWGVM